MAWFDHAQTRVYSEESGAGDPVLLLPGWGSTIEGFSPLREALGLRFRVIAADVPGSGRSELVAASSGDHGRVFQYPVLFCDALA